MEMDLRWRVAFRGEDKDTKLLPNVAAEAKESWRKRRQPKVALREGFISSD